LRGIAFAYCQCAAETGPGGGGEHGERDGGNPRAAATVQDDIASGIADKTRELRLAFSAHIAKWSTGAIRGDWPGYGRSLKSITAELADVLAREERDLFPHAQTLLANMGDASRGLEPARP